MIGLIAWVRRPDGLDNAIANIFTLILGFLATMTLVVWFSRYSGFSRRARLALPSLLGVAVALAIGLLRIDHVTGNLVPQLTWRWAPRHDRLLRKVDVDEHAARIDDIPASATASDFPQFLGFDRSGGVDTIVLDRDWKSHPPKELWRREIGAGWSAFATIGPYAATMEQRGDDELVTFYNWADGGTLLWSHATPARHETLLGGIGPRSTPTIDAGRIYTMGATGIFQCLDAANGQPLWHHDLLADFGVASADDDLKSIAWGRAGSPLIIDDLVIVPAGGPASGPKVSLVAYDKVSGEKRWQAGEHQVSYASPTLATVCGVQQILSVNENAVSSHDPQTGTVLWEYEWPGGSSSDANNSQPVVVGNDRVFLSKGYSGGATLLQIARGGDRWATEKIWSKPGSLKTKFTNVAVHEGYVYGLSDGILECIELETGRRKWKQGRYGHGQLLRVGDVLLVLSDDGELLMVEATPDGHHELGSVQALSGKTWNNLALSGNHLLLRNAEEAVCYELATSNSADAASPGPASTSARAEVANPPE
jgi:outer membrane protein assembly factor BamB